MNATERAGRAAVRLGEGLGGWWKEAKERRMQVTGEQVKAAMIAANITRVDHHDCGGCGEMVFYSREGENLFFNPGCGCSWSQAEPRTWDSAADWINMQSSAEWRNKLRERFGLSHEA